MSALSAICDYTSESEENESSPDKEKEIARKKLPGPNLTKVSVVELSEERIDDPEQHDGRVRRFPHVRGNWASFVYITYPECSAILEILNKIKHLLSEHIGIFKKCDNFHISLSKTFVLKFHWIKTFVDELQSSIQSTKSFQLDLESVKVYCNVERSRTFIALQVQQYYYKYLEKFVHTIDKILEAYNLPTFYKDPSFHMSILWIEGDKEKEVIKFIDDISKLLTSQTDEDYLRIFVDKVHCNIGNKLYQFTLGL